MNTPSADQEHLRLLSIFHYIVGGLTALLACFPLIHLGFGIAMIFFPESFGGQSDQHPPAFVGWLFAGLGAFLFLCGQTLAICMVLSGRYLHRRGRYLFIFIVACVECALMPFGTVLGVFTIIVLSRDSVKRLFNHGSPSPIST